LVKEFSCYTIKLKIEKFDRGGPRHLCDKKYIQFNLEPDGRLCCLKEGDSQGIV
jgi:hypothetical protein